MKLMVIDGNSIINRAFYGVRILTTQDGTPTNAVYGFLTILQKLLGEEQPDALCVCFDLRGPTFRHLRYEGYKSQRKGMPEELVTQMPLLKEILDAMNISRYELEGWEADDLIGTISRVDEESGWDTVVVTGDKDALQLVSEQTHVKLVTTRMGQTTTTEMTPEVFRAEYGFEPIHIVDLKALMGDASDHIPGVPGVGEKTAMDLIQRYHSIDALYEQFEEAELKPAARKKLDAGRDLAQLSYELATIRRDAPFSFHPDVAVRKPVNGTVLYELFLKLEFRTLIDKWGLKKENAPSTHVDSISVHSEGFVETSEQMESLLSFWQTLSCVDVFPCPNLDAVAVAWHVETSQHAALFCKERLTCYPVFLQRLFSPDIQKSAHHTKDLMNVVLSEGLSVEGFVFDTALAAYLLAPTDGSYELETLSITYFNRELEQTTAHLMAEAFGPLSDATGAVGAMCDRAALIGALRIELGGRLDAFGMRQLYEQVELPLCPVLARMERAGFLIDRKALSAFGHMLSQRITETQAQIFELAGESFNINSTQQLGRILFDKLRLPPVKKTKTGYSTNIEVLEKLQGQHPLIDSIMEYRQLTKLNSTYVEGLTKVIGTDGRIHTSFQNTVTATGRLSSTEPNLQNIPVRTELGAELRHMFVAPVGYQLVDADYSQIELRLLAHISKDEVMINAFRTNEDIHTMTASQVFRVLPEEITHEMRHRAKAVNFGIVYGISEFSLSQDIGVTRWEAKEYIDRYFEKYAGVRTYMTDVVVLAKQDGFVSTLMGRRRWLPELSSSNFNLRSFGERVALNMPIQGTAADVMKLAMIHIDQQLRDAGLNARLVLQVHDELIVECPDSETDTVKHLLTEAMEGVMELLVPLTADSAAGQSWAEAKG